MMKFRCQTIHDLLVDYADGDLRAADAAAVREHLEICESCRAELALLQKSLEQARAIWQESSAGALPGARRPASATHGSRRSAAVAAACALAVLTAGTLLAWSTWGSNLLNPTEGHATGGEQRAAPSEAPVDMAEIESLIIREAQSARLAASSKFLADQPLLEEYRKDADRYLASAYEESRAGKEAQGRLDESSTSSSAGT